MCFPKNFADVLRKPTNWSSAICSKNEIAAAGKFSEAATRRYFSK